MALSSRVWFAASLFLLAGDRALAACGSAFCTINSDWNIQGEWTEAGGRFDLRFEFIDQDQPRAGAERVAVGQVPAHHDEVRTINRNWIGQIDYNFNANWGATVIVPLIDRDHEHIHNHHGEQIVEQWNFTDLGDARVLGRYQLALRSRAPSALGFTLGVKLPTGRFDVTNDEGDSAERSLQPGTGTTDLLLGVFYNLTLVEWGSVFTQVRFDGAMDSRDQYRPGDRIYFDVGYSYPVTSRLALQAQINGALRERDQGANAEPEDSGGKFVYFAPGVSYAVTRRFQVFAFVQLPLYQYVNGVQLTADWAAMAGFSTRF